MAISVQMWDARADEFMFFFWHWMIEEHDLRPGRDRAYTDGTRNIHLYHVFLSST